MDKYNFINKNLNSLCFVEFKYFFFLIWKLGDRLVYIFGVLRFRIRIVLVRELFYVYKCFIDILVVCLVYFNFVFRFFG